MLMRSRLRLAQSLERLERLDRLAPLRNRLVVLGEREIALVEWAWRGTARPALRHAAVSISWLGNGLAYLLLMVILLATLDHALRPVLLAGLCVLLVHLIYPVAKIACCRQRPCHARADLEARLPPLDRHSFPSGHAMTLTAALVPLTVLYPGSWPVGLTAWLLMGWSRVACAHHYPSDILAGSALALALASPVTWLLA